MPADRTQCQHPSCDHALAFIERPDKRMFAGPYQITERYLKTIVRTQDSRWCAEAPVLEDF
jgi:hypothetical protein